MFAEIATIGPLAQASDALPVSCTDATLVNEKFVNVAVSVATPNFEARLPNFDVRRRNDRHTPRPGYTTAKPDAAVIVEAYMYPRLHVDLVSAKRAVIDRPAGVADHLGADAIDGGRREGPGDDSVGELKLLLGEEGRPARVDRGVRKLELNGWREAKCADRKGATRNGVLPCFEFRDNLRCKPPWNGNQQR